MVNSISFSRIGNFIKLQYLNYDNISINIQGDSAKQVVDELCQYYSNILDEWEVDGLCDLINNFT